jgi:hypothetical protein
MAESTFNVTVEADDGFWGDLTLDTSSAYLVFGKVSSIPYHSFFRFPGVTIPQGSTINSCILTLTAYTTSSTETCALMVAFNDVDNAVAPTTYGDTEVLEDTAATVSWSPGSWTADTSYQSPEIKTALQEVVDRAGFASGNAVQVIIYDDGSSSGANRRAYHLDASLYVNYDVVYNESIDDGCGLTDIASEGHVDGEIADGANLSDALPTSYVGIIEDEFEAADEAGKCLQFYVFESISGADSNGMPWYLDWAISDGAFIYDNASIAFQFVVQDGAAIVSIVDAALGLKISDWMTIVDEQITQWDGVEIVPEALGIYDDMVSGVALYGETLNDAASVGDIAKFQLVVVVLEYLGFSELAQAVRIQILEAADTITVVDSVQRAFPLALETVMLAVDVSAVMAAFIADVSEALTSEDSSEYTAQIPLSFSDSITIEENVGSNGTFYRSVTSGLRLSVEVELDGGIWECYALSTPAFFPSMYSGYDFNSYCTFDGKSFGANSGGIYELTGETDAGAQIHTGAILSETDFDARNEKRLRRGYLSISGDAPVMVLETDNGKREVYAIDARGKTVFSNELKSKVWKLSVADFSDLASIKLMPIILTK